LLAGVLEQQYPTGIENGADRLEPGRPERLLLALKAGKLRQLGRRPAGLRCGPRD
jgi:hypothetical protein